jgi:CobQ-like glutamine amidotransferase family enzyme
MIKILHLYPSQLGLNGESGNVAALVQRLRWSGLEAEVIEFEGQAEFPTGVDAVFIGSGTLAGALEALEGLRVFSQQLKELANSQVPFLAVGLGWEILGQEIELLDSSKLSGIGIYPSSSKRVSTRASAESFGFDNGGNLTTGYSNHSAEITLHVGAESLIQLSKGFGNSSINSAEKEPGEGLIYQNLMAARLNGPLLPMNPHLADQFISMIATRSGFDYKAKSKEALVADAFAEQARNDLKKRLLS